MPENTVKGLPLWLHVLRDNSMRKPARVVLHVVDLTDWTNSPAKSLWGTWAPDTLSTVLADMRGEKAVYAYFAPRGVEPTKWNQDPKKWPQIRRRFMLLGQTLDGMRVWDIRAAVHGLRSVPGIEKASITITAHGDMAVNAAYAALLEPEIRLQATGWPAGHSEGLDYLNVLKYLDIPDVLRLLGDKVVAAPTAGSRFE